MLKRIPPASRWYWVRTLLENPVAVVSGTILLVLLVCTALAPVLSPADPTYLDPVRRLEPPSREFWFGSDDVGRDIFSRILYGGRVSILIGVTVMLAAAAVGTVLGLISGYYERFDAVIMRTMDGLMAFPSILLAIAIMVALGSGAANVWLALVIVYTPNVARLVRSSTLVLKQQQYVESARSVGMVTARSCCGTSSRTGCRR
jgi:peptide/nickel transport system permease protein